MIGIKEVYLDGSFCSNKEKPGEIDVFFEYETNITDRHRLLMN
jgi:hypothetical protein